MLPIRIIIKATKYYWEENRPVLSHIPMKSTNYSQKFEFMRRDSSCNQHRRWRGDRKISKGSLGHLTSAYNCSKLWVWAWTVVSHHYLSKLWTWTVVSHLYLSKLCCCHCCSAELELCLNLSCPNIAACTHRVWHWHTCFAFSDNGVCAEPWWRHPRQALWTCTGGWCGPLPKKGDPQNGQEEDQGSQQDEVLPEGLQLQPSHAN